MGAASVEAWCARRGRRRVPNSGDNVQGEDGTLLYILHAEDVDADALLCTSCTLTEAALIAHSSADWFKTFGPTLAPFMAGRPEMHFLAPVAGKGL